VPLAANIEEHASLKAYNTFGVEAKARFLVHAGSDADVLGGVALARERNLPLLILGGGSNLLLTRDFPGVVLRIETRGRHELSSDAATGEACIEAAAGESWHDFVLHTLDQGYWGLENLSLIPGTVGAAPIQNIGAYGVELASAFDHLRALDVVSGDVVKLDQAACRFGYRDSVFKREGRGKYIILRVAFRLHAAGSAGAKPVTHYADVRDYLEREGIRQPSARDVSQAVIAIRQAKLPDPMVLGNAGSFFKNPLVTREQFDALKGSYPDLVGYAQPEGGVKLAAGWLIDAAGWKGRAAGGAQVYEKQALVLVNRGGATSSDVMRLAESIRADIHARFGVELEIEPERV